MINDWNYRLISKIEYDEYQLIRQEYKNNEKKMKPARVNAYVGRMVKLTLGGGIAYEGYLASVDSQNETAILVYSDPNAPLGLDIIEIDVPEIKTIKTV